MSSLPVPVSPRRRTVASVGATFATWASTARKDADEPTISSIVDVDGRRVPAEHPALVVEQWSIAHQEPAVLPIVAPGAPLDFKRHAVRQSLMPGILEPDDVLGMEQPTEEIAGQHIGHREPGVVEHRPVGVQDAAVRTQDNDGLSDGIEDLSEFERGGAHQVRYTQAWRT